MIVKLLSQLFSILILGKIFKTRAGAIRVDSMKNAQSTWNLWNKPYKPLSLRELSLFLLLLDLQSQTLINVKPQIFIVFQ